MVLNYSHQHSDALKTNWADCQLPLRFRHKRSMLSPKSLRYAFIYVSMLCGIFRTPSMTVSATRSVVSVPFPRAYLAEINTPDKDVSSASRFAAEVDLISFSKMNNATSKVSFIVLDQEELIRLRSLSKKPHTMTMGAIKLDVDATTALQEQINQTDRTSRVSSPYTTITNFPCYKNLQGSFSWMDAMVERAKSIPGLNVTKTDIGDSYLKSKDTTKGYDIWVLKVTGTASAGAVKGVFFVMSGIHAREYAPPELASRWIEVLINSYGNDADISAMLDFTEIHLVLHTNPDGRAVAETNRAAMRRKNLNPNSGKCKTDARGVDLNRNFPFQYGRDSGSSSDECSITYRGKAATSEPEVLAIVEYTKSIFPVKQRKTDPVGQQQVAYPESNVGVFLDIHSYGQLVLSPWLYTTSTASPNADGFLAASDKVQYFTKYTRSLGYVASGTTADYAYGILGVAGMSFELGNSFYQDCSTFENSIYPTNLKPLTYLAKISSAPFSISKGPDITSLTVAANATTLTVRAAASDSAFSYNKVATSKQTIREIRAFVNTHPYAMLSNGFRLTKGRVSIDVSSLASGSRNVVCVQATDSAGYRGPVTATYFIK